MVDLIGTPNFSLQILFLEEKEQWLVNSKYGNVDSQDDNVFLTRILVHNGIGFFWFFVFVLLFCYGCACYVLDQIARVFNVQLTEDIQESFHIAFATLEEGLPLMLDILGLMDILGLCVFDTPYNVGILIKYHTKYD